MASNDGDGVPDAHRHQVAVSGPPPIAGSPGEAVGVVDLVARDVERDAAIRSVRFSAGTVIAGEAGVGKTSLAGSVADVLAERGVPVVRVLATAAGRSIPFAALGPLLPVDSPDFHPALVPAMVLRTLGDLGQVGTARVKPLLLVDDAQLLDDHSAAALLSVVHQQGARALVTVRLGGRPPDAVTALWKDGLLDRIDLQPLDLVGADALLRSRLGGEVATVTVKSLWDHSQGNPLYLTELVRFGVATGRLSEVGGVWWWPGDAEVPPRLGELLQRRIEDVTPAAAEARDVLALGEPLPYDTLATVVSPDAIMELDEQGIVTSDASGGIVRLRFSHPLLFAVAARRLSPARRRALAGRLLRAPAEHVDLLRRAAWQEAAGGRPDVDLLVRASRSLIVTDPMTAIRFAERALGYDDGPSAAVTLADAQAEAGRPEDARTSLAVAAARVRDPHDQAMVGLSEAGLMLWSLRRPGEAIAILSGLERTVPAEVATEPRSARALLTLFSAQPAEARRIADEMLAGPLPPTAKRRCLMVRMAALTVGDQPDQARVAGTELGEVLRTQPTPPSARSMSTAIAATAELFGNRAGDLPTAAGSTGRWPTPRETMDGATDGGSPLPGPAWPLLEGVRHHLAGDCTAAAVALREAAVQQLAGEGLFRSEATGGLAVVLAETGRLAEARKVLVDNGPDDVAVIPGMRGWAQAWVLAASGRSAAAAELAVQTATDTAAAGAISTAFWYLADAARFGGTQQAVEVAESLADLVGSDISAARLAGIRARAANRPEPLAEAAEAHVAVGLFGHAAELASRAMARAERAKGRSAQAAAARAGAVATLARRTLGSAGTSGAELPEQLTRREAEIAQLAAQGMRDKDIADELVLSVRTVESHLATAYRKLGIASRRELIEALGGQSHGQPPGNQRGSQHNGSPGTPNG